MKKIPFAAALVILIVTPASAQSKNPGHGAALGSYASDTQKSKSRKAGHTVVRTHARTLGSPHSDNPEYDVYVRGEYVGSDPDPRVRWTLRDDAKRGYGMHD
jgi:hypothetical protein